jgi:hypothetical protein
MTEATVGAANELGAVLGFADFDPERIDISEIRELTEAIPRDGNVDVAVAESLATRFLRGADRCAEILAQLTWWEAKADDEKRRVLAHASLVTAAQKGLKTATERRTYAEGDLEYLKACEASNRAKAMKQWFKNKHDSLVSAHYLMKDIAKGARPHQRASGQPDGAWGEQEWR